MYIIFRLVCETFSSIAVKISFLWGNKHGVYAAASISTNVMLWCSRNDTQIFASVNLYINIIFIAQWLSGVNSEILHRSNVFAHCQKLCLQTVRNFVNKKTFSSKHVSTLFTAFLNYVTATLRALFVWRGSHILAIACTMYTCYCLHYVYLLLLALCILAIACTMYTCYCLHYVYLPMLALCMLAIACTMYTCHCLHNVYLPLLAQCILAIACTMYTCYCLHHVYLPMLALCILAIACTMYTVNRLLFPSVLFSWYLRGRTFANIKLRKYIYYTHFIQKIRC